MLKEIICIRDYNYILNLFENLGNLKNESERMLILKDIINNYSNKIIEGIKQLDDKELLQKSTTVSGAGMIKIKIFSHKNGEIRLHFFSGKEEELSRIGDILNQIDGEPHIHDFQAISKILSGEIIEENFKVQKVSEKEQTLYKEYLREYNKLSSEIKILNEKLLNSINSSQISKEFINNYFGKKFHTLSTIFTAFNSKKSNNGNKIIENFYPIGIFKFKYEFLRNIKKGEIYELKADRAHRIISNEDTITLFVTDTTYESKNFKKKNDIFLRGHAKRIPNEQNMRIERSIDSKTFDYIYNNTIKLIKSLNL